MDGVLKLANDVFDYHDALRRLGDDDLLRMQAQEFLQLHDEHVRQIREAVQTGNAPGLLRAARTLRLALTDLAGSRCLMQLVALERAAKAGAFSRIVGLSDGLEQELADLILALDTVASPSVMN